MFIPEKVEAAFVKRHDTYTNNLGYVVPYVFNAKGESILKKDKLNSILKWASSQQNNPKNETIDNIPRSGFIVNGLVGGVGSGWGRNDRQEKIRVWHPEGFEFEIVPEQFFHILSLKGAQPGSELNGEYVLYWPKENGTGSVQLISVDDPDYKKYYEQLEKTKEDVVAETFGDGWNLVNDLVVGNLYKKSNPKSDFDKTQMYVYLGKQKYYKDKNINATYYNNTGEIRFMDKHLFVDINDNDFVSFTKSQIITQNEKYDKYEDLKNELLQDKLIGDDLTLDNVYQSICDGKPILSFINNSNDKYYYTVKGKYEILSVNNNVIKFKFVESYTNKKTTSYTRYGISNSTYDPKQYTLCQVHWSYKLEKPEEPQTKIAELYKNDEFKQLLSSYINKSDFWGAKKFKEITINDILHGYIPDYNTILKHDHNIRDNNIITNDILDKMKITTLEYFDKDIRHYVLDGLNVKINFDYNGQNYTLVTKNELNEFILKELDLKITHINNINKIVKQKYRGKEAEYIIEACKNGNTKYVYSRKEYDVPQEYLSHMEVINNLIQQGYKIDINYDYDYYVNYDHKAHEIIDKFTNIKLEFYYMRGSNFIKLHNLYRNDLNTYLLSKKLIISGEYNYVNFKLDNVIDDLPEVNIDFTKLELVTVNELDEYIDYLNKLELYNK